MNKREALHLKKGDELILDHSRWGNSFLYGAKVIVVRVTAKGSILVNLPIIPSWGPMWLNHRQAGGKPKAIHLGQLSQAWRKRDMALVI